LILCALINLTISAPSIKLSISMLFHILHTFSILTESDIFLNICLSKMRRLFSSFAVKSPSLWWICNDWSYHRFTGGHHHVLISIFLKLCQNTKIANARNCGAKWIIWLLTCHKCTYTNISWKMMQLLLLSR
jgi:hypothetical protein